MNALALLDNLRARGVGMAPDGDRLSLDAPPGVLTPKVLAALAAKKAELLVLLQSESAGPEQPPREGATWDDARKVWRWRHWIMRTRLSLELESALPKAATVNFTRNEDERFHDNGNHQKRPSAPQSLARAQNEPADS